MKTAAHPSVCRRLCPMFSLLIKIRLLSLWNVTRHAAARHKVTTAALTLGGILLFVGLFYGFQTFLAFGRGAASLETMVYEIFFFLFMFLLAGAVPFVASTLLHASDYLLLSAAPVHPRAIVAAKLLDATVTNSLQFAFLGLPALFACAAALTLSPLGGLVVGLVLVLFVLLPALLTAFLLLVALAVFGTRRVRGAVTAVNAIMATTVCLTIVVQASRLQIGQTAPQAWSATLPTASPLAQFGPSGLFARVLLTFARGSLTEAFAWLSLLTGLIGLLLTACVLLGERSLSHSLLSEEGEGETPAGLAKGEIRPHRHGILRLFSPPVAALIAKDLRYVVRDNVLLSQMGMPVILFFVPFVLALQEPVRALTASRSPSEFYPFAAGMVGIILFMQTSILSLSAIGLEGRSFALLLAAPNGSGVVLRAKWLMSSLVTMGVGLFLTLVSGFVFRAEARLLAAQCVLIVLSSFALCGMGVGIAAAFPRFVYENPAHRVSVWALVLGFLASGAYLITGIVLLAGAHLLVGQLPESAPAIYGGAYGIFCVLTLLAILLPLSLGTRRLTVYQWEH